MNEGTNKKPEEIELTTFSASNNELDQEKSRDPIEIEPFTITGLKNNPITPSPLTNSTPVANQSDNEKDHIQELKPFTPDDSSPTSTTLTSSTGDSEKTSAQQPTGPISSEAQSTFPKKEEKPFNPPQSETSSPAPAIPLTQSGGNSGQNPENTNPKAGHTKTEAQPPSIPQEANTNRVAITVAPPAMHGKPEPSPQIQAEYRLPQFALAAAHKQQPELTSTTLEAIKALKVGSGVMIGAGLYKGVTQGFDSSTGYLLLLGALLYLAASKFQNIEKAGLASEVLKKHDQGEKVNPKLLSEAQSVLHQNMKA